MKTAVPSTDPLNKLIAIRRSALDRLRQDLSRLNALQDGAELRLNHAIDEKNLFLEEIRREEHSSVSLQIGRVLERRNYLAHLEKRAEAAKCELIEISNQREKARSAVESCNKEIRALDRLFERRDSAKRQDQQRRDYASADDSELIRRSRIRVSHDIDG